MRSEKLMPYNTSGAPRPRFLAILFADIFKSSAIYESLGDQGAREVIGEVLARPAVTVNPGMKWFGGLNADCFYFAADLWPISFGICSSLHGGLV
ncbi:MAG: hypothetical protein R6X08_03285 [Desulfosalsimonadaceae bacterium]